MSLYISLCTKDLVKSSQDSYYSIQLPQRVSFQKQQEVALIEISYSNSIRCFQSALEATITITYFDSGGDFHEKNIVLSKFQFINVKDLVDEINDHVHDFTDSIQLTFHEQESILEVEARSSSIVLSNHLKNIFGLSYNKIQNEKSFSKKRTNLFQNYNFLNILTDIIEPQMYCKSWKPVLRRFLHEDSNSIFLSKTFAPIYFPVAKTDFDVIRLQIEGDNRSLIEFSDNNVNILLHFRDKEQKEL